MAIEQDPIVIPGVGFTAGGNLDQDHRRAAGQAHHLQGRARQAGELRAGPAGEKFDGLVHVTMGRPVAVEGGGFVGDADVVDQRGNDFPGPAILDELRQLPLVHSPLPHSCFEFQGAASGAEPGRFEFGRALLVRLAPDRLRPVQLKA